MANYYQPEIETMPYQQLRQLQNDRFMKQMRHVWDNVPYYRQKMEDKGVTIDDIHSVDDLHKLPFLSKDDLREAYPYGLKGVPLSECVRIQSTSGTTGKRPDRIQERHLLQPVQGRHVRRGCQLGPGAVRRGLQRCRRRRK